MTRLRLAIFDVDGTLVDSQAHIRAAMGAAFDSEGLTVPEDVLGIVGLSLPVAVRTLAPEVDEAVAERMVAAYKAAFFEMRSQSASPLYPGAREALEALAARDDLLLGVATGKSRRGLDHLMEEHGLKSYFVTEQVADHHPSKPHPSMVLAALAETGVEPDDAVMIGDTGFDMQMGRAGGVRTIGVSWGYHGPERLTGADRVIAEFGALPAALDDLTGAGR